jgi:dUTP pyrophosphatase
MRAFEVVTSYQDAGVVCPKRATSKSAGYDLAAIKDVLINPGQIVLVPTGLKVRMPDDEALFVFPRSSLGIKKGLMMSNGVGIIDADYYGNDDNEGHIMIPLLNIGDAPVEIKAFERVAQGVFLAYKVTEDDLPGASRLGGFGSSGL